MRRRILLADDSVTIQKVIELTFLDEDYEVKAVSNGDEAIAALPQVDPDFVIADVHMPGANGYEVCRRSKEMRPGIPVLLLVGTFEPFDEAQARSVGADSFLKKPFDSQELLQRVEELLASRATQAAASPAAPTPTPAPPPGGDLLEMPSLSELPPLDLGTDTGPSPTAPSAVGDVGDVGEETDWGGFQLESPAAPEPFPSPFPREMEEPRSFAAPSFEETPFSLGEEPSAGGGPRIDERALLPADEPIFELEAEPEPEDSGLRGGEFGETTPALEMPEPAVDEPISASPSFETPSFEPPSFETPSFEVPSFETPSFEIPEESPEVPLDLEASTGFGATPEERLGVPQGAAPLVESRAETEARIEAPPPASLEASHEPASTTPAPIPAPAAAATAADAADVSNTAGPAVNGSGRLSDEDVDRIARRVVELMADRAVRDVAWEVIPDLAELVIRDRLRELENQAESFE